jgi:hypothetical protein
MELAKPAFHRRSAAGGIEPNRRARNDTTWLGRHSGQAAALVVTRRPRHRQRRVDRRPRELGAALPRVFATGSGNGFKDL